MKIARLCAPNRLRNFVSEGGTLETEMKSKQIVMMTLALSLAGMAHAGSVDAVLVTPKMLQVVRMHEEPLAADLSLIHSFNACSDAIRESSRDAAREVCASALRTTRTYMRELTSSPILHGTIRFDLLNSNLAAAYSNAALAYWRAGDLRESREHMAHARSLAPTASFVVANAAYLGSDAAATLAKN